MIYIRNKKIFLIIKKPLILSGFFLLKIKRKDKLFNIYNMRNCKYRNCKNEVIGLTNKKFCCIKCKRNELKYKQRNKKKLLKDGE